MTEKRIVVLTGAGISAESGIATFRASDGLWENHRVEDVATPEGFARNPKLVHEFYNARRARLHDAIAARFQAMLDAGFVDEVRRLQGEYPALTAEHNSMRCVGYRQAWDYLAGACGYAEFAERGTAATRQLANRQLTWLRKIPADTVLDPFASGYQAAALAAVQRHFACAENQFQAT